jgi:FAD synthetase
MQKGIRKEILKEIWTQGFLNKSASQGWLTKQGFAGRELEALLKDGFVERDGGGGYRLTGRGREKIKVVVCGGVFDILHPGHVFFLTKSKDEGDLLVVIIAKDSTVEKRKRIPIVPEEQRLEMVRQIKPVDVAIVGCEGDFLKVVEDIGPDVIVLGPDQRHDEELIESELEKRGLFVKTKRMNEFRKCALYSTRSILQKIIERGYPDERDER